MTSQGCLPHVPCPVKGQGNIIGEQHCQQTHRHRPRPHVKPKGTIKNITPVIAAGLPQHLLAMQVTADVKSELTISPETAGKRRRIQHDYRRLSSSGFVDDESDVTARERNSAADRVLDAGVLSTDSKVQPLKLKVIKVQTTPETNPAMGGLYILLNSSIAYL